MAMCCTTYWVINLIYSREELFYFVLYHIILLWSIHAYFTDEASPSNKVSKFKYKEHFLPGNWSWMDRLLDCMVTRAEKCPAL